MEIEERKRGQFRGVRAHAAEIRDGGNQQTVVLLKTKWEPSVAFALSGTLVMGQTQGNQGRDSG